MATKRMTWMAAALGAVALSGMVSCNGKGGKEAGAAAVGVSGQALTLGDVKSVSVTVTGGIANPLTVPLVGNSIVPPTQYSALISDLPIGCNYVFTATATNTAGATIYQGVASGQCITKNQTANIIIDMNDTTTHVTVDDEAPFIDSITDTAACVAVGDTVTIKATAHDSDPGDTAGMTFVWSVPSCGTLSTPVNTVGTDTTPGTSTVVFTAVTNNVNCQVNLVVKDARMPTTLQTTAVVAISIGDACAYGNAKITAIPDTCPAITGLTSSASPLVTGVPTTLTVTASDSDGDALSYHWTSDCNPTNGLGHFLGANPASATGNPVQFVYDSALSGPDCIFTVTVDDGTWTSGQLQGQTKCSVITHMSLPAQSTGYHQADACTFGYDYMSTNTVGDGDQVTIEIAAPCSNPVWSAGTPIPAGNLTAPFTTGVTFIAPTGAGANGATVTVTCPDCGGGTLHTFTMIGVNSFCTQPGVSEGADCTLTAQLSDKCILTAACHAGQCQQTSYHAPCGPSGVACQDYVCQKTTGQCANQPSADGTDCTDGLACDGTADKCAGGACHPTGTPVSCPATGNPCMVNACTEPNGSCVAAAAPSGTACDDGNACTGTVVTAPSGTTPGTSADFCNANGVCVGSGATVACPSGDVCTAVSGSDTQYTCPVKVCMGPANAVSVSTPLMFGMGVAPDATLWTTGSFANFSTNPINFGAGPVYSSGGSDVYLNKVSATGLTASQTFTFGYQGGGDQVGTGVAVASTNNVGLIGNYYTEVDFDPIRSGDPAYNGGGGPIDNFDFLAKSSLVQAAAMNFVLVASGASTMPEITPLKAHNIDVGTGAIVAVASNPSQNKIAICGKSMRLVGAYNAATTNTGLLTAGNYGTGGSGTTAAVAGGSMDIVVAVIDASNDPNNVGKVLWGRQFGGAGDQACESVAMDSAGNVAIAGNYNGVLNFHPTNTALQLTKSGGSTSGALALPFVAVLDPNGTPVQAMDWGTSGASDVNGIAFDSSGNVVIGGALGATIAMPKADATLITVTDLGKTDGFVAKLNPNLSAQWAMSFGDASYAQAVKSLALSSSGDVFIGGNFEGTLNGLNGLVSNGNATLDAFSAELSGTDGSVLCAQEYGDTQGTQSVNFVTVANAATGSLANNVVYGGSYSNTITFGTFTLNTGSAGTGWNFLARLIP